MVRVIEVCDCGRSKRAAPWLTCQDSTGQGLAEAGLSDGRIFGSFIHMIDRTADRS